MSTPETPSQNPTPDAANAPDADHGASPAPAADTAPADAGHGASDERTNGHAHAHGDAPHPHADAHGADSDEGPADDKDDDAEGEGPPADASGAPAAGSAAQGEKKRRRRRRKKKTGAQPGADAAPPAEGSTETADAEGAEAHDASAEGAGPDKGEARRKREKRTGPPRERPPVNGGDIIFGKILEITDEAIFVDIPGKAHAIFDRREMLLPDDEEAPPPPRPTARPDAASGEAKVATATPESASPPDTLESAPEAPAAVDPGRSPDDAADLSRLASESPAVSPPPAEAAPVEGAPEPAAPNAPAEAQAPAEGTPREPKVPRVILEVGADFIGVVHNDGARGGLVVLTHHPHRAERAKPVIEKAFNDKALIDGLVTGVIKGGIEVDVDGVRAFAPGSHVDLRLGADLGHLVGRRLSFLVTQYAKRGRDVVLSRKSMLEDEARKARTEALARLKVGEELDGVVRSVVPFGAFVDVGGIEGLVPLKEMSHNRADGPSDVFKAGEATRVKVVMIDDKGKVWLSHKATIPDPWQQVAQRYAVGTRHAGKVARLQPFGAFVELEPGVDGLIHTQDLSIKRIEAPGEVVKVGDAIDVVVSHVDASQHKIALHPAPQGDAAGEAPQRVAPHKPVKAKVVQVESGGLVVRILGVTGRNARGYVTAAGTGTPRGTELRKAFNVGQEVEAKVIEMDPRRGEVKLSIKALSEDQERNAYQQYRQQLKAEARFTFGDLLAKKGTPSR